VGWLLARSSIISDTAQPFSSLLVPRLWHSSFSHFKCPKLSNEDRLPRRTHGHHVFILSHTRNLENSLTSLIGLATLIGIMTRPFRWNEAIIAMVGAAVLLLLGLISPVDAFLTLIRDWNTFFFFLGMMGLSALAEAAGLFDWLAVQAARLAGQSAARLFLNVFLLGTLISMILSNDATALILTPIVYLLVTKLRLPVLPYLFACTFIADTASFLLPISNPINIIILSRFPLDLWAFLRVLLLPSLVVIAKGNKKMLVFIDPSALPALRTAGIVFLIIDLLTAVYIFRNRRRLFGKDPDVHDDIKAVRNLREEVIVIPWILLTTLLVALLVELWRA
jgi:Na+/H+ antiporter NhaD/arsenite permease-like protein